MSPIPDLVVSYHQQDDEYCCGAACAEMLLVSPPGGPPLGGSLPDPKFQQKKKKVSDPDGLYNIIYNEMCGLPRKVVGYFYTGKNPGTHPDVLAGILNQYSTNANIKFQVFASTNQEDIACRVAYTLEEHHIAPVILMYGGQHWAAVAGCKYELKEGKTKIDIIDFLVQDPYPRLAPSTHAAGDGCGNGAVQTLQGLTEVVHYRGFISVHIPYTSWCCEYMAKPIPKSPPTSEIPPSSIGTLNDKYVAVCAVYADGRDAAEPPEPAPEPFRISTSALPCPSVPKPVGKRLDADLKQPTPKSVDKAITVALNSLADASYTLRTRSPWDTIITKALISVDRTAIVAIMKNLGVVARFANDAPDFFLVPIKLTDGSMPLVVRVALDPDMIVPSLDDPGDFGGFDYVDSVAVPLGDTAIDARDLDPVLIRDVVIPVLPPPNVWTNLKITKSELVWTPCIQSFSPFIPFYQVSVTSHGIPLPRDIFLRGDFQVDVHSVTDDSFLEPDASLGGI